MKQKVTQGLVVALLATGGVGCDAAEELLKAAFPPTGPRELSDDDAFKYLRKNRTEAPPTDVEAVAKSIDMEVSRQMGEEPSMMMDEGVAALQRRNIHARKNFKESDKQLDDFFEAGLEPDDLLEKAKCSGYRVDLSALESSFILPHVDRIPVRNQGYRGTCAAFTGIGALEYAALNPNAEGSNPSLPTLDLSEQRFYYDSKPDCQRDGCKRPYSEGSWYGVGFDHSVSDPDKLNVPLETDCPYNSQPADTDLHTPLKSSCDVGAVSITEMGEWCGMDELVELLHQGYAIPYASPLDSAWERNDGLITKKAFAGAGGTVHAGGHAYLIVGYKKLPQMPEEGGVCFIIKNSWDTGWGVNGYSCMTLEWMKAVTFDGFIDWRQPVPVAVKLRDDLQQADELPPDNEEAEEDVAPDLPEELDEDDKKEAEYDNEDDQKVEEEEQKLEPLPEPEPAPEPPPAAVFEEMKLWGPGEAYYRIEVLDEGDTIQVRGILRGDRGKSSVIKLRKQGKKLFFDGDQVGAMEGDELRICTQEWAPLCSLRYRDSDKRMYVQFRDEDLRSVKPEEISADKGSWLQLPLGNTSLDIFVPDVEKHPELLLNPKTFIRYGGSEPARMGLRPAFDGSSNFHIKLGGQRIGALKPFDITNSTLCSGEDRGQCNIVMQDNRLHVVPRNEGLPRYPRK